MMSGILCSKYGRLVIAAVVVGVLVGSAPDVAVGIEPLAGAVSGVAAAEGPSLTSATLKMVGALCFCLGVLAFGVRVAKRFSGTTGTAKRRRIEVREKAPLSSKAALYLIAVDNREYLVASGSDAVSITPTNSLTTPLFAESLDEVYQESGEANA